VSIRAFFIYRKISIKIFQSTRTSPKFHLGDTPEGKKAKALAFGTGGGELVWGNLLLRMK
jgi:hypothetical protein